MMIARNAQADGAILLVGDLRVWYGIKIEVDYIIQGAYRRLNNAFQLGFVIGVDIAENQRREITDDEIAGLCNGYNYSLPILCLNFGVHRLDLAHILCNFGTEIGAVDHALMPVGVSAIRMVAVKDERRAGFYRRFQDEAHQLFYRDFPF